MPSLEPPSPEEEGREGCVECDDSVPHMRHEEEEEEQCGDVVFVFDG